LDIYYVIIILIILYFSILPYPYLMQ